MFMEKLFFHLFVDILQEFNDKLAGVSHGMGTRNQLPPHQLNVAEGGATSSSMPEQVWLSVPNIAVNLVALNHINPSAHLFFVEQLYNSSVSISLFAMNH